MAIDVREDTARTVVLVPPSRWTAPTGSVLNPAGTEIATPTPTVDAVDTTIAAAPVPTASTFDLTSAVGVSAGSQYLVTTAGTTEIVRVGTLVGTTVTLSVPLSVTPITGDAFQGVEVSVALTSTETATRGMGYLVEVAEGEESAREVVNVVRHVFEPPIKSSDITRFIRTQWPGTASRLGAESIREVERKVHQKMRNSLLTLASYPNRVWDPPAFEEAGLLCAMGQLVRYGLVPPNYDPGDYVRSTDIQYNQAIGGIIRSLQAIDTDDSGAVDNDDQSNGIRGVRMVR